jgi:hypothetical protein
MEMSTSIISSNEKDLKLWKCCGMDLMSKFIVRLTRKEALAKCTAEEEFSINAMRKSKAIKCKRKSKEIEEFYKSKFEAVKAKIEAKKAKGFKCSITIDDCTYSMITLHGSSETYSLGFFSIPPRSCGADVLVPLVREKLSEFGLSTREEIVAFKLYSGKNTTSKKSRNKEND